MGLGLETQSQHSNRWVVIFAFVSFAETFPLKEVFAYCALRFWLGQIFARIRDMDSVFCGNELHHMAFGRVFCCSPKKLARIKFRAAEREGIGDPPVKKT